MLFKEVMAAYSENRTKHILLAACVLLFSYFAYSSTLKMEAVSSSENCINFYRTTRRYVSEDASTHNYTLWNKFLIVSS
jgi:hypothetical protein